MIYVFLIFLMWMTSYPLRHMPIFTLNKEDKQYIENYGLVHFTKKENVKDILEHGLKGSVSNMGYLERRLGKLVWTYKNQRNLDEYIKILQKKSKAMKDKSNFEVAIILNGFSETDMANMRKRIGFNRYDKAIVYKGEYLNPASINVKYL